MHYSVTSCIIASLLLSGCSIFSSPKAEQEPIASQPLRVPAHLSMPPQPAQFDIPEVRASKQLVDTKPPGLVVPLSASSRVDEEETKARIWFDRNDYSGDLQPYLESKLSAFFNEQGISYQQADELVWTTGWVVQTRTKGAWFWKSEQPQQQAKFRVSMEPRPHGRSIAVLVEMLEHQYFEEDASLLVTGVKREEAAFLNRFTAFIGADEFRQAQLRRSRPSDSSLELAQDGNGAPSFLSEQSLEVVWTQLESLFDELSLAVTDLNRSTSTYYLNYRKPRPGIFSRVFRRNTKPVLPIAEGGYQVVLSRVEQQTSISFRDAAGQVLTEATLAEMEPVLLAAIAEARIEL